MAKFLKWGECPRKLPLPPKGRYFQEFRPPGEGEGANFLGELPVTPAIVCQIRGPDRYKMSH